MRNQNPPRIQVKIETPCNSPIDVIHKKFKEVSQSLTIKTINYGKKKPGEPWYREVCVAKQSGRTGYSLLNGQRTIPLASRGSGLPWRPGTCRLWYKKHLRKSQKWSTLLCLKSIVAEIQLFQATALLGLQGILCESQTLHVKCLITFELWFFEDYTLACRLPEGIRRHAICAETSYRQRAKQLPTQNTSTRALGPSSFLCNVDEAGLTMWQIGKYVWDVHVAYATGYADCAESQSNISGLFPFMVTSSPSWHLQRMQSNRKTN